MNTPLLVLETYITITSPSPKICRLKIIIDLQSFHLFLTVCHLTPSLFLSTTPFPISNHNGKSSIQTVCESCTEPCAHAVVHTKISAEIQVFSSDFKKRRSPDRDVTLTMAFSAFSIYVNSTQPAKFR